jgi:hypothetical protein
MQVAWIGYFVAEFRFKNLSEALRKSTDLDRPGVSAGLHQPQDMNGGG